MDSDYSIVKLVVGETKNHSDSKAVDTSPYGQERWKDWWILGQV